MFFFLELVLDFLAAVFRTLDDFDFAADLLAVFLGDFAFLAVLLVSLDRDFFGNLFCLRITAGVGVTASSMNPVGTGGTNVISSSDFAGSGLTALCAASETVAANSFTASTVFPKIDLSSLSVSIAVSLNGLLTPSECRDIELYEID